jgi:hypothetical protein
MEEKLVQALKSFDYRRSRYQINYSVAMWHSPEKINLNLLSHCIRVTDRIICFDNHHYAIVYDYTTPESCSQAVNNFLLQYKNTFSSTPLFCSVVNSTQFECITMMVPELLIQLNETIQKNQMLTSNET